MDKYLDGTCEKFEDRIREKIGTPSYFYIQCFLGLLIIIFFLIPPEGLALKLAPTQKVLLSGTVKVEAQRSSRKFDDPNDSTKKESDITLATVEVAIDAKIHPFIQGHILFLWEEDKTEDIKHFLNEGTITISNPDKSPYYLTVGKIFLPFGSFETVFITDPMTLELGKINETVAQIGHQMGNTDISFGYFNGDKDKTGRNNKIKCYFANLSTTYSENPYNLTMGASYLSNMADTDGLESAIDAIDPNTGVEINNYVQGIGIFIKVNMSSLFFSAEYLAAMENFENGLFMDSLRPQTYNLELGWRTPEKTFMTLKYEKAKDMEINDGFNFPKKRYGICLTHILSDNTYLNIEYLREKYYNEILHKGKNDIIAIQLAINF